MTDLWYKNSYRRLLVDMHIDASRDEFFSKLDENEYVKCLKAARIKSAMVYLQAHTGYCYWDTASGEAHPAIKGTGKIKRLIDMIHGEGMDVIAYYSLVFNNWLYDKHPSWRMMDVNGNYSRDPAHYKAYGKDLFIQGGRYGLVCPNNQEYRDFTMKQFEEYSREFDFEGIFFDMTFWPFPCYCEVCQKKFREATGQEIPRVVDWTNPLWLKFQQLREDWMADFAGYFSKLQRELKPGVAIEQQYAGAFRPWTYGVGARHAQMSDYCGGDLYGGFEQQSFAVKVYHSMTANQPFEYMTSRCDHNLQVHTTTKPVDMLKTHAYLAYAHHGAFMPIDAIDPVGTLDYRFYKNVGKIFEETMPYEKFFTGELMSEVAIYYSMSSKMNTYVNDSDPAHPCVEIPHLASAMNAGISMRERHIPYRIVPYNKPYEVNQYKVVILPDVINMTEEEENRVIDYVASGGSVYMSGRTSKRLAKELLGIEVTGVTKENITYIAPTDKGERFFEYEFNSEIPMTYLDYAVTAVCTRPQDVLAKLTLPYTDPQDLLVMSSIHSNPPGIKTDHPALVYGGYGKGKAIWSACAFEKNEQMLHRDIFINLIKLLYDSKDMIVTDAPRTVEFTVFDDPEENRYLINCVHINEKFPILRIRDFNLKFRTGKKIKDVVLLPDMKPVPYVLEDGYVSFDIKDIELFRMYSLIY